MLLLIALLTTTLHAQVVRRSPRRDTSHLDTDDEGCVFDEQHRRHCLPRLVGVASVRGGSTSLATYLNFHPRLTWGERKEHQFFRFRGDLAGALEDRVGAEWAGRVPPGHAVVEFYDGEVAAINVTWSTGSSGEGVAPPVDRPYARQGMPGARDKRNALSWRDYALEFPVAAGELAFDFDPVYLARRGVVSVLRERPLFFARLVLGSASASHGAALSERPGECESRTPPLAAAEPPDEPREKQQTARKTTDRAKSNGGPPRAKEKRPLAQAHGMMSRASLASISRLYGAARRPLPKLLATFRDPAVQHCARNRARHVAEDERGEASAFRAAYASCVAALADGAWAAADGACRPPSKAHFHNYCYAEHVAEWAARGFAYRLVKAEELRAEATRGAVVRGVLDWLGLDASALPPGALDDVYNAHGVDELPDEFAACVATMRRPRSYLSACNAALAARERDDRWLWWAPAEDPEPAPPPPHYEEL